MGSLLRLSTTEYGSAIFSLRLVRKCSSAFWEMVRVFPNQRRSGCTRPGVTSRDWNAAASITFPCAFRTAEPVLPESMLTLRTALASR